MMEAVAFFLDLHCHVILGVASDCLFSTSAIHLPKKSLATCVLFIQFSSALINQDWLLMPITKNHDVAMQQSHGLPLSMLVPMNASWSHQESYIFK